MTEIEAFVDGFVQWLYSLTLLDFLFLTIFTIVVDVLRNVGKGVVLAWDSINRKVHPFAFQAGVQPKISVLVPAHNEAAAIKKTIASLLENPYPNKEIIIIDDHSTDGTYEQALPYHQKGLIKLVRRTEGKGSKSAAINYGAVFATGDYLMIMDGDTLIERGSLGEIARHLTVPDVMAVSGNVRILSGDGGVQNLLTRLQAYEYLIAFEIGRRFNSLLKMLIIIPGAFGVFPRAVGRKIGLYDRDTIGEDFDLTMKLLKTGGRVVFVPNAVAYTYCPSTWKAWMRQRIRWAHGQFAVLLKHGDVARGYTYRRQFVLAIYDMILMDVVMMFVRMGGLAWIAFTYTDTLLYVSAMLFMLYLANEAIAILTAAAFSPRRSDLKYVYLVPVMVFFYRPFYSYVRLYAYFKRMFGSETAW